MNKDKKWEKQVPWLGAVVAGGMLAMAFPPLDMGALAWVALVPLLIGTAGQTLRRSAWLGFLAGCICWIGALSWLRHVTVAGWLALACYCALFFIPPALFSGWWLKQFGTRRTGWNVAYMLLLTLIWCGTEYFRAIFLTGFAWNPLGSSQWDNLPLLQIVSVGGITLVSGVIVWVNAGLAVTMLRYGQGGGLAGARTKRWHPELMLALLVWAVAFSYGTRTLLQAQVPERKLRVGVVQPNIPQNQKWLTGEYTREDWERYCDFIYTRLYELTLPLSRMDELDLMIWPETAVPDDVLTSKSSYGLVLSLVTNGVPLLVGSMDTVWLDDGSQRYYNSSFLFDRNGVAVQGYDKQHLVMFGEYVPLADRLPFIKAMTPIQESFSCGTNAVVFHAGADRVPFAALICFEDTVATLAREAVQAGARVLVNQSNDAWFDPSSGSLQHMIHSVLRAVENRVPVVRVTNTGVSCAIGPHGRILAEVELDGKRSQVAGTMVAALPVPPDEMPWTPYTRHGDGVWKVCMVLTGFIMLLCGWSGTRIGNKL